MSDSALFPASPSRKRVWSVWAGQESQLNLLDRIFTCIRPRVQPLLLLDLVGEFVYGLVTVIPSQRIALMTPLEGVGFDSPLLSTRLRRQLGYKGSTNTGQSSLEGILNREVD